MNTPHQNYEEYLRKKAAREMFIKGFMKGAEIYCPLEYWDKTGVGIRATHEAEKEIKE